jgi:transposase InsO family protein
LSHLTRWLSQYRKGKLHPGHKYAQPTADEADQFIVNHQRAFPVGLMCRLFKVARRSFYAYCPRSTKEPSKREERNTILLEKIKTLFEQSKRRYGSPRVHRKLLQQGEKCSLGRVKRLMRQAGLYAVSARKYKPKQEKAEVTETKNLLLEPANKPTAINQVWHSDIPDVPTDEGWLYLAGVMDGFSKYCVGYAMADHMKTDLVIQALRSAVTRRNPDPGLIHHSDKGSHDTSYRFQAELNSHNMQASFTGTGACLDHAIIESFWATLKKELIYQCHFKTRDEARLAIFEYIEVFDNRERLHSSLLSQTPHGFELTQNFQPKEGLLHAAA